MILEIIQPQPTKIRVYNDSVNTEATTTPVFTPGTTLTTEVEDLVLNSLIDLGDSSKIVIYLEEKHSITSDELNEKINNEELPDNFETMLWKALTI